MTAPWTRNDAPASPSNPLPRSVWLARWLWLAATAVGFVRSVIQLSDRRTLTEQVRQLEPELAQHEVDAAVNGGIMFSLLVSIAVAVLYVFLATRTAQGRNWARVIILVLCGLLVFSTAMTLLTTAVGMPEDYVRMFPGLTPDPLSVILGVVIAALDVAVFVLLLRPESGRFFAAARKSR
ncbi:hypothetical protein [Actinopolyspora mortivallis]|uniref:Uncharacterized protein n=1 Tax=Actinopolyspora mortivallis TaxID=33906 RepID=A0A2T0GXL9_ACTMO|nr:hypothetical protein [Actinopolyspora mortivallis]PRW63865.1 hypothetical protein CEP50_07750 [Actinopolyspora mortivallis]